MKTTFKINLNKIQQNYEAFASFGEVYYPVKTNHNKLILKRLQKLGSGFECDSIPHIKKIYKRNIADKIIFSNVAKSKNEILWAIKHNIIFYTVDDKETLKLILNLAKKYKKKELKINVRLNVFDIFRKEFIERNVKDSRLGASVQTCKELINIINSEKDIKIFKGLSFYVQVEIHNKEDNLSVASEYIAKNFSDYKFDWINIGGGRRSENIKNNFAKMMNNFKRVGVKKFILEPGRFIVTDAEDVYIPLKRIIQTDLNGGECVVSLQMGIYNGLNDIILHKRKFEIYIQNEETISRLEEYDGLGVKLVLRGQTADSIDIIGIYKKPTTEINEKSIILIKNVGAYVEVFYSEFSGKVDMDYKIVE